MATTTKSWSNVKCRTKHDYRNQLKSRLDSYCHFTWRGEDAFDKFGAFILGSDRKVQDFFNGPSFTNEYSAPQYQRGSSTLLGVNFSQPSFAVKIGLYYISEQDYRNFIEWFNPYEINWFMFGFEPNWSFQCKLKSIGTTSRSIIGKCIDDEDANLATPVDMYYAETTITMDLIGDPVVYSNHMWEFKKEADNLAEANILFDTTKDVTSSELEFPFDFYITFNLSSLATNNLSLSVDAVLYYDEYKVWVDEELQSTPQVINLFTVNLSNLSYHTLDQNNWGISDFITIHYVSSSGLLLYRYGNSKEKLLSLQNSVSTGERLVRTLTAKKFNMPGTKTIEALTPTYSLSGFKVTAKTDGSTTFNDMTWDVVTADKPVVRVDLQTPITESTSDTDLDVLVEIKARARANII